MAMKINRITSVAVTACLLVSMFAFTAFADQQQTDFINVLDYTTANGSGSNTVTILSSDRQVVFSLPLQTDVQYVEALFTINGTFVSSPTVNYRDNTGTAQQMTVTYLGDNVYRVWTDISSHNVTDIVLEFPNTPAFNTITFYNVSYSYMANYAESLNADGNVYYTEDNGGAGQEYLWRDNNGGYNVVEWQTSHATQAFTAGFHIYDWRAYDYIDIIVESWCAGLTSITVEHGSVVLPFTYTLINSMDEYGRYAVAIRIDLSGIERSSVNNPYVAISGIGVQNKFCSFKIDMCAGRCLFDAPNDFQFWMTKVTAYLSSIVPNINGTISSTANNIRNSINSVTSAVVEWGQKLLNALTGNGDTSEFQQGVDDAVNNLQGANDAMNAITRPNAHEVLPNLGQHLQIDAGSHFANIASTLVYDDMISVLLFVGVGVWLIGIVLGM